MNSVYDNAMYSLELKEDESMDNAYVLIHLGATILKFESRKELNIFIHRLCSITSEISDEIMYSSV